MIHMCNAEHARRYGITSQVLEVTSIPCLFGDNYTHTGRVRVEERDKATIYFVYALVAQCEEGRAPLHTVHQATYSSRVFAKVRFSKCSSLKIVPKAAFAVHFKKKGKNVLYRR